MSNHPIVHIEIPAQKAEEAGKFYGDLFDWKIESDPMYNYVQFQAEGGPGGGLTDDIDATLAKVESLGGKTLLPKTEIPHVGWWGVFSDPTGNRIGLFTGMGQQS